MICTDSTPISGCWPGDGLKRAKHVAAIKY